MQHILSPYKVDVVNVLTNSRHRATLAFIWGLVSGYLANLRPVFIFSFFSSVSTRSWGKYLKKKKQKQAFYEGMRSGNVNLCDRKKLKQMISYVSSIHQEQRKRCFCLWLKKNTLGQSKDFLLWSLTTKLLLCIKLHDGNLATVKRVVGPKQRDERWLIAQRVHHYDQFVYFHSTMKKMFT